MCLFCASLVFLVVAIVFVSIIVVADGLVVAVVVYVDLGIAVGCYGCYLSLAFVMLYIAANR